MDPSAEQLPSIACARHVAACTHTVSLFLDFLDNISQSVMLWDCVTLKKRVLVSCVSIIYSLSKRHLNLLIDTTHDMIDLSEEGQNFSEIISTSEEEIVSLGIVAGTSVTTASTAIYDDTELQSESSESEQSNSMHDVKDENCCVCGKADWIQNGTYC
jgi:hypothetical protein